MGEVFGEGSSVGFPLRPVQLSMMSFDPEARACADELFSPEMRFDLVLSLEVAEHVPPAFTGELIQRLAKATAKYLVFSAARPGQGGTGHIDESMHNRTWWIDSFTNADRGGGMGKLRYLPQLSRAMRHVTAYQERAYDLGTNLIALGAPGVEDVPDIPQIAHDCAFGQQVATSAGVIEGDAMEKAYIEKHHLPQSLEVARPCPPAESKEERLRRRYSVEGQAMALWPELDLLIRRVRSNELACG